MATTYDYVDNSTGTAYFGDEIPATRTGRTFVVKRHINLATAGDSLGATSGAFAANDVLSVFKVYEGILITGVAVECTTAEGATLSTEVGDGDDTDGYISAFDMVATGWFFSGDATYKGDYCDGTTLPGGRLYTAADTIDVKLVTAGADVAVFDIYIMGIDLRPVA